MCPTCVVVSFDPRRLVGSHLHNGKVVMQINVTYTDGMAQKELPLVYEAKEYLNLTEVVTFLSY